ncbi:MAG: cytochrome c [Sulfurimonas sp.]|nr:cytochrome c [Sulfurimonas sp.]
MKQIFLLFFSLYLMAESTFISPIEYASQLYKNPRGIGCQSCHGDNGEGKLVATYIHKKKKKEFRGPAINGMNFNEFYKALNKRKRGMPRYFLTKKEIQALYLYLNQEKKNVK